MASIDHFHRQVLLELFGRTQRSWPTGGVIGVGVGVGAGFFFFIVFFIRFLARPAAPRFAFLDFFATFNLPIGLIKLHIKKV